MLVGGGGADQIAACAKYANSVGVPYIAEGVGEAGLGGLSSYFAASMTYKQQGPLLAQYIKNVVKKTKVAMVRANTANFEDGHQGFLQGVQQQGLQMVQDFTIPKDASASEVQSAAVKLCGDPTKRPDVVYPLMSPAIFLQCAYFTAGALFAWLLGAVAGSLAASAAGYWLGTYLLQRGRVADDSSAPAPRPRPRATANPPLATTVATFDYSCGYLSRGEGVAGAPGGTRVSGTF